MYMAPIVRSKPPVSAAMRRATGAVVLPVTGIVMVPFLAAYAAYAVIALTARGLLKAPQALVDMVDYAGTAILGE